MSSYAIHSDANNDKKMTHKANLDQINADLRALHGVSPQLYDESVKYILEYTTSALHMVTKAAVKLAFDIGQDRNLIRP